MSKEQNTMREETDIRLLENRLLRGQTTAKQVAEYLEKLPDLAENAEEVVVVMEKKE